ncbi:hypothetical protein CEXT_768711 [Caerostris extrusa]|uniref:Uncharacterized protein n=1 Tax=Caerostris extrusa TaxID=172846 RepID=A0AAV4PZB0_CAEEX|nr:hypothetical protein CEXT_768711 [Caerostris extrusa]
MDFSENSQIVGEDFRTTIKMVVRKGIKILHAPTFPIFVIGKSSTSGYVRERYVMEISSRCRMENSFQFSKGIRCDRSKLTICENCS